MAATGRLFTIRSNAPRAATHLGTMHAGQRVLLRTSCGRFIGDEWITLEVSARAAVEDVTCTRCKPHALREQGVLL